MSTQSMSVFLATALGVMLSGCSDATPREGADVPGELLGNYQVHATLTKTTCAPTMFDAPAKWDFVVRLSRADNRLFWNNGAESIQGKIESDGVTFSFSTQIAVPVKQKLHPNESCTLWRQDRAYGQMNLASDVVVGFDGGLQYDFYEAEQSHCIADDPELSFVNELPCRVSYQLSAKLSESSK